MKFGFRVPSLKKRIAARTSWKRYARHSLGLKAPRGWGWVSNPSRAAYNRVYNRTTFGVESLGRTRHSPDSSATGCLVLLVIIIIGLIISAGWVVWVPLILLTFVVLYAIGLDNSKKREEAKAALVARQEQLCERFGPETATRLIAGEYWIGASAEMLRESLGPPAHIRERILKTKTKETYCYNQIGKNRYALRIHLENGFVVGWEGNE